MDNIGKIEKTNFFIPDVDWNDLGKTITRVC